MNTYTKTWAIKTWTIVTCFTSTLMLSTVKSVPKAHAATTVKTLHAQAQKHYKTYKACLKHARSSKQTRKCKATFKFQLRKIEAQLAKLPLNKRANGAKIHKNIRTWRAQARISSTPHATPKVTADAESTADLGLSGLTAESLGSGSSRKTYRTERKKRRRPKMQQRATRKPYKPYKPYIHTPRPIIINPQQEPTDPRDSTGGESYRNYGVNTMQETKKDKLSTFAIDVDTASYTMMRSTLQNNHRPHAASVRVEEFINYFKYNYPAPASGPFAVDLEAAPSPFSAKKNTYIMRVGVQGMHVNAKTRKPVHLTFLVDVSGSMNRPDKLGLAKQSLRVLTHNLHKNDSISLVTYAAGTRIILEPTKVSSKNKILQGIQSLKAGGGTAMGSGMDLAYKMALKNHKPGHVNRVLVVSDGDANIGATSYHKILDKIRNYVADGVTLSTIGFGMGSYRDTMMEQLANRGNGNYYYVDSLKEAKKIFGDQLNGTLEVIAKDVKIQVEFNPKAIARYRLIGYENRDIADKDFRNDRVDAGEIGAGHTVTALYEVEAVKASAMHKESVWATVRVRHKKPEGGKATESRFAMGKHKFKTKLSEASHDFQFAIAVAGFAEILRKSPYAKHLSLALIEEVAKASSSKAQKDRQEFLTLVSKAKNLSDRKIGAH